LPPGSYAHLRATQRVALKVLRPELAAVIGDDVAPDGTHFVMLQPVDNSLQATVAINFAKEVRTKMAASRR